MTWEDFSIEEDDNQETSENTGRQGLLGHMSIQTDRLDSAEQAAWQDVLANCRLINGIKPWTRYAHGDVIGIQKPTGSQESTFATIMGLETGSHGVHFFLGDWGYYNLNYLLKRQEFLSPRLVSRVLSRLDSYRVDFMSRAEIPDDYARHLNQLGFRFRGSWPFVTEIQPNRPLAYPTLDGLLELNFLLEQLITALVDLDAGRARFSMEETILTRMWSGADQRWLYRQRREPDGFYLPAAAPEDELTMARIARLPLNEVLEIAVDLFRFRNPVRDTDGSYINLYLFVATDADSAEVITFDTVRSSEDVYGGWLHFLIKLFDLVGRPGILSFDDELALTVLEPFLEEAGIFYELASENPAHDMIFANVTKQMAKRGYYEA